MNIDVTKPWVDRTKSAVYLEQFASPYLGVAPAEFDITYQPQELPSTYVSIECCKSDELIGYPANPSNGGGGTDKQASRWAGIAETIERYSAVYIPEERVSHGSAGAHDLVLPGGGTPFSAAQYRSEGFPYAPFSDAQGIPLIAASDVLAGTEVAVPAQWVFLNPRFADTATQVPRQATEQPLRQPLQPHLGQICYATSNGLACGPDMEEAFLSALLEAAERDAIMITWNAQWSAPLVDLESSPETRDFVRDYASRTNLEFAALDLTQVNGIPACLGTVTFYDGQRRRVLGVGGKASWTLGKAAVGALTEALLTMGYSRSVCEKRGVIPDDADFATTVLDLEDHVRLFASTKRVNESRWLTQSAERTDIGAAQAVAGSTPGQIAMHALEILRSSGIRCAGVDVTAPDIAETPLRVVKVVSDKLVPLSVGWKNRYNGFDRLFSVPSRLPGCRAVAREADLNPLPHPFP
ncbi:YcaO-like family protein [Bifidobacterium sp.]|uniref:YcaO-like family protein n=1 Tax=Bifidobacterium sp. TaxID=41200 RepID=UPI0039EC3B1A